MKKTKIICSIGPSSTNWETFKSLVLAGMNVARINFSHASLEERETVEKLIKRAREELKIPIATLYDTKGPDLRTGDFEGGKIDLVKGNTIKIYEKPDEEKLGTNKEIYLNYKNVLKDIKLGQTILLDDGFHKLIVTGIEESGVECLIQNSGTIKSRRGVCMPGMHLNIPFISKEDEEDIKYACEKDGDFLAVSFVNTAAELREVRELCKKYGREDMQIIAKVETQFGVDNLEEIVQESDYIMVARGDLSIETGVENLPLYQARMIDMCHDYGKGVIVATQMMYSMKTNIRPTNAEVTDVAGAVMAGCDAIMTSDETTIGSYPVETVKTMTSICENVEEITKYNLEDYKLRGTDIHNTIAKCATKATTELNIKAIVASTLTGKTALDISSLRPSSFIVATVTSEKVARLLSLKWGVYSYIVPLASTTDNIVKQGVDAAKTLLDLEPKDLVVVVGGFPKEAHTNFLKIQEIN